MSAQRSSSGEREGGRPVSPWRRAGRVTLAILNPFSDIAVLYRRAVLPAWRHVGRVRSLVAARRPVKAERLGWAQAVAATGLPAAQLVTNYRRLRGIWWCLMTGAGLLSLLVLTMLCAAGSSLPDGTFWRAVVAALVLAALSGVGFVRTLGTAYRLWQLTTRRVSRAERGTFNRFLAETRWLRQTLLPGG